jgi:hypothetical protein
MYLILQFIVPLASVLQACSIQGVSFRDCSEVKTGDSFRQRMCDWSALVLRLSSNNFRELRSEIRGTLTIRNCTHYETLMETK